jgi:hypothetical protein
MFAFVVFDWIQRLKYLANRMKANKLMIDTKSTRNTSRTKVLFPSCWAIKGANIGEILRLSPGWDEPAAL